MSTNSAINPTIILPPFPWCNHTVLVEAISITLQTLPLSHSFSVSLTHSNSLNAFLTPLIWWDKIGDVCLTNVLFKCAFKCDQNGFWKPQKKKNPTYLMAQTDYPLPDTAPTGIDLKSIPPSLWDKDHSDVGFIHKALKVLIELAIPSWLLAPYCMETNKQTNCGPSYLYTSRKDLFSPVLSLPMLLSTYQTDTEVRISLRTRMKRYS